MPFVDYFANSPLANWFQLFSGPGVAPLKGAADAYAEIARALARAASGTDSSTVDMANSWEGLGSERAQAAFRNHSSWVRDQVDLAARIARIAEDSAYDHIQAKRSMPTLAEILKAMVKRAQAHTAMATATASGVGVVGLGVAAMMVAEAEIDYMILRLRAAESMQRYEIQATGTVKELLAIPIEPPPPIVNGPGAGTQLLNGSGPLDHTGVLNELLQNGPDTGSDTGGGPDSGPGPGPQDSTGPGGDGVSDPTTTPSDPVSNQITDPGQNMPPELTDSMIQDLVNHSDPSRIDPELFGQDSLFGTSSTSPTLTAMGGGIGSLVGLGMVGGGLGSMSGAATGFRMPANWKPGTGTAFGAGTGTASTAPVGRPASRPGVSAPTARMRRRRKEDEDKPGKVFAPGEHVDVPVLERPPAIGVIEYEPDDELIVDDDTESSLVGVLERLDGDDHDARRPEPH
ncbi:MULTISPECIES: PPE domain-containing protein [Nocardia]|uniref:PPE domain-containing protein n=1 Tax=Nocardia TaxID=1817 RepID=UPI001895E842|nr:MULTISPECIES: PPE domain-containing protein [Nocardia]MBF6351339.1 PPE domain-containing protein [Nocardia flavorosea]